MPKTKPDLPSIEDLSDPEERFYDNEDGIYLGIPEEDYHEEAEPATRCSQTILSELLDYSPRHAKAKIEGEFEPSSTQKFGTALHCAVLTPDVFETSYGAKDRCAGVKADGDRCTYDGKHPWVVAGEDGDPEGVEWFCSTHEPEELDVLEERPDTDLIALEPAELETLSESKMEKIERIKTSLETHPAANNLLTAGDGAEEITVLWTWGPEDISCKSRIDRFTIHPELGPIVVDLKTTRTAKPGVKPDCFGYKAAKYGYHRQAAFYSRALAARSVPVEHYFLVSVEKSEPHDVVVSEITGDALTLGDDEIVKGLRRYSECLEDGLWPGYRRTVEPLELPSWAYDQM